jgi:hypothetical protein
MVAMSMLRSRRSMPISRARAVSESIRKALEA